ncbi:XrtA system polysaccharide chain length determinant [Rhodoferax sp. GW822-FHT02A01]|uniref:XrtA system polysaccharide chain length determinant n=1 Tax=Rhodoferax sp. GW822-FHT02A01 TaxID=3141537 RepID=UPI00315CECBD
MWRHRWAALAVAWIVAILGAGAVVAVPDKYEATARIFVDTQSILKPLMSGLAVQPNVEQQVTMLSRTLISRPNVEKLIRMADLDLGTKSKEAQEALIDELTKALEIKSVGRDNLYALSYRDSSPDKAKRVVQSLVSIFVESSLGDSRKDSEVAKKFIDEQIKAYETKLEEAETRLKEFKLRNIDMQTGDGKGVVEQIGAIGDQLSQARLELREAENARDSAKRQLEQERASYSRSLSQDTSPTVATPEIDARIDAQKRNLDALLQKYTDKHPDVTGARRMIQELEEMKRKEVAELRKAALANPGSPAAASPAQQEMSRLLANAEVQVASLRARVGEYSARYERARQLMKSAPQIEAEFAQLNRDYDINKKNYNDMVARRESAALSGDLDNAAGVADFRLIDPPRTSPKPVAPNRLILLPMALAAAIAAGLGVAFLLSQIRAVFFDPRSLTEMTGLPLLGTVSLNLDEAGLAKRKADLKKFAGAFGVLLLVYAIGMALIIFLSGRAG